RLQVGKPKHLAVRASPATKVLRTNARRPRDARRSVTALPAAGAHKAGEKATTRALARVRSRPGRCSLDADNSSRARIAGRSGRALIPGGQDASTTESSFTNDVECRVAADRRLRVDPEQSRNNAVGGRSTDSTPNPVCR